MQSYYNPSLLKESEQDEKRLKAFITSKSLERVTYLCNEISKLGTNDEHNEAYRKLLYELIKHCQKGYIGLGAQLEESEAIEKACLFLLNLYHPLIKQTVFKFVSNNQYLDKNEVVSYANAIFKRLITGNTPWMVETYKTNLPSPDMRAELADIRVKKQYEKLNRLFTELKKVLIHPSDQMILSKLYNVEQDEFSTRVSHSPLTFVEWTYLLLNDTAEKWKNGSKEDKIAAKKLDAAFKNIDLLTKLLENNLDFLSKKYKIYKKQYLRNHRYDNTAKSNKIYSPNGNIYFSVYIRKFLFWGLKDLYKRRELKHNPTIRYNDDLHGIDKDNISSQHYTNEQFKKISHRFTNNQKKVIRLMIKGFSKKEIAKKLDVSEIAVFRIMQRIKIRAVKK